MDYRLYATEQSWIEGESLRQLERVSALSGMKRVAGFPDLHPGKGGPVGAAMLSAGLFYPYLIGSDAGCGMALFSTDLPLRKARPERWAKQFSGLEEPWDGDTAAWLSERGVRPDIFTASLGTIGMGNHFAELMRLDELVDRELFNGIGLDPDNIALLVHSGSRGLGQALLRSHTDRFRDAPLRDGSPEAEEYLKSHDQALAWASANRELIALRLLEQAGADHCRVIDLCHNSLTRVESDGGVYYLHRKGAAPSDSGAVIIPGSRGGRSCLAMPVGDQSENLFSVAHGAGRKWSRGECEGRLHRRFTAESLKKTAVGSYVICEDKGLLYEEAPQAYKDIEAVVGDMVSLGLVRVIAWFMPVLTYKVRG